MIMIQELNELQARQKELSTALARLENKVDLLLHQAQNHPNKPPKELLDVVDVAELCMVTQSCVYKWASRGLLSKCKVNGRLLFRLEDVRLFIDLQKNKIV